jgi:hypothetical protein
MNFTPPPGGGSAPNIEVGPTDWLDWLNIGVLVGGTARRGRFSIFTDVVYLSMTKNGDGRVVSVEGDLGGNPISIPVGANLNLNTRSNLDGLAWTIATGYTIKETGKSSLDIFAGARLFDVDVSASWDLTADVTGPGGGQLLSAQGSRRAGTELWNGIVGVRGHIGIGDGKWSVPYYFDAGAGSSDMTWNAIAGLSRAYDWGNLLLAYRHLEYDEGSDGLL